MLIIPAIDIKDGKCVRLEQGDMNSATIFSDKAGETASKWKGLGAQRLHVVDLNGAIEKSPQNLPSIQRIIQSIHIPVQVGGGIRDLKTIQQYFDIGMAKVVIGTEAIRNPELVRQACKDHPGGIVVGIDARKGRVAIEGWTQTTDILAIDLARQFEDYGVAAINFTDIHRDGMQTGPNIEETRQLAEAVRIPIVASGGVSTLEDIRNLLPLSKSGVIGVITGKALYSGTLNLKEAIELAKPMLSR